MSKYTIQLNNVCDLFTREVVESWFSDYKLENYLTEKQISVIIKGNMWNKGRLAKMIVNHYYFNEIGFETPALFRHYVKTFMDEIMEKYLPIIYTQALEYNPLINEDYTETFVRNITDNNTTSGSSHSNSSANGSGLNVNSDTPQGMIIKDNILNGNYASSTSATESTSSGNENITSNSKDNRITLEDYTKKSIGNRGVLITQQKLIKEYRELISSTNKDIIDECRVLFMGLY